MSCPKSVYYGLASAPIYFWPLYPFSKSFSGSFSCLWLAPRSPISYPSIVSSEYILSGFTFLCQWNSDHENMRSRWQARQSQPLKEQVISKHTKIAFIVSDMDPRGILGDTQLLPALGISTNMCGNRQMILECWVVMTLIQLHPRKTEHLERSHLAILLIIRSPVRGQALVRSIPKMVSCDHSPVMNTPLPFYYTGDSSILRSIN